MIEIAIHIYLNNVFYINSLELDVLLQYENNIWNIRNSCFALSKVHGICSIICILKIYVYIYCK